MGEVQPGRGNEFCCVSVERGIWPGVGDPQEAVLAKSHAGPKTERDWSLAKDHSVWWRSMSSWASEHVSPFVDSTFRQRGGGCHTPL